MVTDHSPVDNRSAIARVGSEGVVQLPLTIHHGYPLIAGEVNGKHGQFILDTGSPFRFFLNSNFVPITVGLEVGRGHASSGQPIVVQQASGVISLTLGANASHEVNPTEPSTAADIMAADFNFIQEGPVPDFLGFIGAQWLSRFAFSLRYSPARWLLAETGVGAERLLDGSERVALVRLEGKVGPLPYATFQIDGVDVRVRFDTGTPGVLQLTPEFKSRLEQVGALRCVNDIKLAPSQRCLLKGLRYGSAELILDAMVANTGLDNQLTLGTALLGRYVSVWNLSHSTIDLRRELHH